MKTILRISDGTRSYPFVYEDGMLYWPDDNPEAFGENIQYKLSDSTHYIIFDARMCLACVPFRYESHNYSQCIATPNLTGHIVLTPWEDTEGAYGVDGELNLSGGRPNIEYISVQSAHLILDENTNPVTINYVGTIQHDGPCILYTGNMSFADICAAYSPNAQIISSLAECVIMDEEDIYWKVTDIEVKDNEYNVPLSKIPYTHVEQWQDGLRFVSIVHLMLSDGENILHLDIRAESIVLTQMELGYLIQAISGKIKKVPQTALKNMKITRPKIVNKTIQQVVEITSQTDSKSNIIQPVFFRTREMASIIVHPAVTENICINLDAYKSQVDRFYIKVEGVAFPEIGRTESGVIFKVQGSLLPGTVQNGTYYVLNEDTDLVTTGKYTYES